MNPQPTYVSTNFPGWPTTIITPRQKQLAKLNILFFKKQAVYYKIELSKWKNKTVPHLRHHLEEKSRSLIYALYESIHDFNQTFRCTCQSFPPRHPERFHPWCAMPKPHILHGQACGKYLPEFPPLRVLLSLHR